MLMLSSTAWVCAEHLGEKAAVKMETATLPEGLVGTVWLLHFHEKACYSATQWVIGCVAFATLNLGPGLLSVQINPQSVEI